eukprot:6009822-Pyramimonas_sp.AAC.1
MTKKLRAPLTVSLTTSNTELCPLDILWTWQPKWRLSQSSPLSCAIERSTTKLPLAESVDAHRNFILKPLAAIGVVVVSNTALLSAWAVDLSVACAQIRESQMYAACSGPSLPGSFIRKTKRCSVPSKCVPVEVLVLDSSPALLPDLDLTRAP